MCISCITQILIQPTLSKLKLNLRSQSGDSKDPLHVFSLHFVQRCVKLGKNLTVPCRIRRTACIVVEHLYMSLSPNLMVHPNPTQPNPMSLTRYLMDPLGSCRKMCTTTTTAVAEQQRDTKMTNLIDGKDKGNQIVKYTAPR